MRGGSPGVRLVPATLLACLVGCGGPVDSALYPVTGTLLVGDQPAANAMVAFHPLDPSGPPTTLPVASTSLDGSYRLTTHALGDGAPAGEYAVTVVWPDDSHPRDECDDIVTHDRFDGRYADPSRSPWRITVGRGPNEVSLRAAPPTTVDSSSTGQ